MESYRNTGLPKKKKDIVNDFLNTYDNTMTMAARTRRVDIKKKAKRDLRVKLAQLVRSGSDVEDIASELEGNI